MSGLVEALEEFQKQRTGAGLIVAEVLAVNNEEWTIDVKDGDDNEYLDVRLNATPSKTGMLIVPKVGSSVIVLNVGKSEHDYLMIHAGEIAQVIFHAEEKTEVLIDDAVIRLGTESPEKAVIGEELNKNLNNLLSELDKFLGAFRTFVTNQAAVTANPPFTPMSPNYAALLPQITPIKAALTGVKNQLNQHLSETVKISK